VVIDISGRIASGSNLEMGTEHVMDVQITCRENANTQAGSTDRQHWMNPTGRYENMFEKEKRKFIETTTEILIKKK
jgi:hypothetical protein